MEARLRDELRALAPAGLTVGSAGTRARAGEDMAAETLGQLQARGVPVTQGFQARQLTSAIVAESALVLTASREQRAQVLEIAPLALRRAFTLREFAALLCGLQLTPEERESGEWLAPATAYALSRRTAHAQLVNSSGADIDDPYGHGEEAFERMATEVDASIRLIVENVAAASE